MSETNKFYKLNVLLDKDQERKLKEICKKRRLDMTKQIRIWIDNNYEELFNGKKTIQNESY